MTTPPSESKRTERRRRLAARLSLPRVSGKASAWVLAGCLALTTVVVLLAAQRLPTWLRFEIVLAAWWLIWWVALAVLLHRGLRVSDDHRLQLARNWFGSWWGEAGADAVAEGGGSWLFDGEGCAVALGVVAALLVLVVALWLLVEIAIPLLAFLTYLLVRGMLAKVVNDKHGCNDSWPRAVLWGGLWATVYTAPLAVLVWLIHWLA